MQTHELKPLDFSPYSRKIRREKKTGNDNPDYYLAQEIYEHYMKQLAFSQIRKWIKENGRQCVNECFREVLKVKGTAGLLIYMINKYQTPFK